MRELPILFSTTMVQSILRDEKTMTRRVSDKPRYQVGDHLWVRETFYVQSFLWNISHEKQPIHYKADGYIECLEDYIMKSSLFMPKWAARIWLEVTAVKAERLQNITLEEIWDEGVHSKGDVRRDDFIRLWDSINGKAHPWKNNDWVQAYTFKRIRQETPI